MIDALINAIVTIAEVCVSIVELLIELLNIIFKMIELIPVMFNPVKIMNDIIAGITMAIKLVFRSFSDLFSMGKKPGEPCKDNGEGLCGYRKVRGGNGQIQVSKEKENAEKQGKKCVSPSLFRLITMVVCPPLALFLHSGPRAWFHIILAALLSVYCFYFPGLIYVAMHILC
jgi:uncharacterized membrane protein YqaE (UPF0057 family)